MQRIREVIKRGDKVNKNIKVVFMGTPEFSVPILEGLIDNYNVIAVH